MMDDNDRRDGNTIQEKRRDRKDPAKETVAELAEEAAETRREAVGADKARNAFGSGKAAPE